MIKRRSSQIESVYDLFILLRISQPITQYIMRPTLCDTSTWKWPRALDIDFIHGHIHGQSCERAICYTTGYEYRHE